MTCATLSSRRVGWHAIVISRHTRHVTHDSSPSPHLAHVDEGVLLHEPFVIFILVGVVLAGGEGDGGELGGRGGLRGGG